MGLGFSPWNFQFQNCGTQFCRISRGEKAFSRISKGNVTNLKSPEGAFQKSIPTHPRPPHSPSPPTGLEFFWNSPITDRWVSSKKSNYYNRDMAIETTSEKIPNRGGGLKTWNFLWVYWKIILQKFQRSIKKRIVITRGNEESLGFWSWKFHGVL